MKWNRKVKPRRPNRKERRLAIQNRHLWALFHRIKLESIFPFRYEMHLAETNWPQRFIIPEPDAMKEAFERQITRIAGVGGEFIL